VAEVDHAWEVSMSGPTVGTLRISSGLVLERCNPSFVWSDDSRYLAVPQYFHRWGVLRVQRLVVVDVIARRGLASPETAWLFQLESFSSGALVVTKEPLSRRTRLTWGVPEDLAQFTNVTVDRAHV